MSWLDRTAAELSHCIKEGKVTVGEVVEAVLERIEQREGELHCYITVDGEGALQRAGEVQRKIDAGILKGPLVGVPFAVKDNLCTAGIPTTCASRMLESFVPSYSSEAVLRLEAAGAVLIGKTNMDEFAMGSTTETSAYGVTRNPWNVEYVPGGSSGGSAAAVAAGECFMALGTDTGGSIRQPAAHCGVVGLKPTYGTVSRYGLVAYASSMDQIGPLAKDVRDCALILETLAAHDVKDATSMKRGDTDFSEALVRDVSGMRIGLPRAYFGRGLSDEVREAVLAAAMELERQGAVVEEFDLRLMEYAVPAYYVIASGEAGSNLARYDGVKYGYRAEDFQGLHQMYRKTRSQGFGDEVKRRILLGNFVLSTGFYDDYYLQALKAKALIKQEFDSAFARYDLILGPAAPSAAPKLGAGLHSPMEMYLGDTDTVCANLAGIPGITLPCGINESGLPIGVQLLGDCFQEKKLIRAAYTYEQARGKLIFTEKGGEADVQTI